MNNGTKQQVGLREGAGRKRSPHVKVPVSVRLSASVVQWLKERPEGNSQLIEDALAFRHNLEPSNVRRSVKIVPFRVDTDHTGPKQNLLERFRCYAVDDEDFDPPRITELHRDVDSS